MNCSTFQDLLPRFVAVLAIVLLSQSTQAQELPSIFNGKDLDGWKVPEGKNVWFTVDDGVLNVQSGPEKKGQTLWTKKEYENFVMKFDFKFGTGTNDTGIYIRNDREQIQIGISGSLKRDMTGLPYIPGKKYPVNGEKVEKVIASVLKLKDWNSMTIAAIGKTYTVWINGTYIMNYESESAEKKGPIGIQLHGNREMSCHYRSIKLAEL